MTSTLNNLQPHPSAPTAATIAAAQSALSTPSRAELVGVAPESATLTELLGVNSPEHNQPFVPPEAAAQHQPDVPAAEDVSFLFGDDDPSTVIEAVAKQIDALPAQVELAYDVQHGERSLIDIAGTADADEDEPVLLAAQTESSETWPGLPFTAKYFGFSTRTSNALDRAGYKSFQQMKGMQLSDVKSIKGLGASAMEEILSFLKAEDSESWFVGGRGGRRSAAGEAAVPAADISDAASLFGDNLCPSGDEDEDDEGAAPRTLSDVVPPDIYAAVTGAPVAAAPAVTGAPVATAPAVTGAPVAAEAPVATEAPAVTKAQGLKILVLGSATQITQSGRIASFEQVYGEQVAEIERGFGMSIALVEYSKGWAMLASAVAQLGWPKGVDVLCVSKSMATRFEVLSALRRVADIVIES